MKQFFYYIQLSILFSVCTSVHAFVKRLVGTHTKKWLVICKSGMNEQSLHCFGGFKLCFVPSSMWHHVVFAMSSLDWLILLPHWLLMIVY